MPASARDVAVRSPPASPASTGSRPDVRALQTWLHNCGARWIEDYSPNGGRHVYIPLEQRVTFAEARDLVEALGTRYRTLDKTPHQNLLHGCMRTPGSPHKRGGHQELAMSLNMAYDIARRPQLNLRVDCHER